VFHVKPLKRPVRRTLLVVHVAASAGWLGLTLATTAATVFALRPAIADAAESGAPDSSLVAAPLVSTGAYLFMTVISVLKPWGLTRRGRRLRSSREDRPVSAARGRSALRS
jgi:hypothetical protein